jgi:hypothetical protein
LEHTQKLVSAPSISRKRNIFSMSIDRKSKVR